MNNYCTNCGIKLKTYAVACKNCGTAIADVPLDCKHEHSKKTRVKKLILFSILGIALVIWTIWFTRKLYVSIMSKKLLNEYVVPFLNEEYGEYYSNLEFDMYGKCITSGNCYTEPLISCDGNGCEVYTYLSRFKCMSFFYKYEIGDEREIVTVFKKDGKYQIVRGRNIYGYDDKYSDSYLNYEYDEPISKSFFVKYSNFESDFISLDRDFSYTYIVQDRGNIRMNLYNRNDLSVYFEPNELADYIEVKGYNEFHEEIKTFEVQQSNYNSIYIKDNELDYRIKYLKVYIGEVYE